MSRQTRRGVAHICFPAVTYDYFLREESLLLQSAARS
jgi:hypothetical protein